MSSGTTATASSCACEKTARNHPTQPASANAAPRTLTDMLVTSPANRRVAPKATMKGQAVRASPSIVPGCRQVPYNWTFAISVDISPSPTQTQNYSKKHDPNDIDDMR